MSEAPAATAARSRSGLYVLLARSLAFPEPDLHRDALRGDLLARVIETAAGLPYRLAVGPARGWRPLADYDAFQSEYIRLFEVGPRGHSACPLYGGHYGRDRLRTMEELVRFYNYFGLRIAPARMPDHVTVELEFMHYLTHEEAAARRAGGDRESYLRAQRDFLDRHLGRWWPLALAAANRQRPRRFYRSLVTLADRFVTAERRHIASALGGS